MNEEMSKEEFLTWVAWFDKRNPTVIEMIREIKARGMSFEEAMHLSFRLGVTFGPEMLNDDPLTSDKG